MSMHDGAVFWPAWNGSHAGLFFYQERKTIMALVKYGGGITQMSGSIGGSTFARNRFGNYARSRTKPINPNSTLQVATRAALSELTTRWAQTLDAAQRAAWNLYASSVAMKNRLGEAVYLTGFNHYIRSNAMLARLGLTTVDAGPVIFELPAKDPAFAVTATEAPQEISIAFDNTMDWSTENDAMMYIFLGQPQNPQRNFFGGPWRANGRINGIDPAGAVTPWTSPPAFALAEGQRVWTYARILRADGRLSEPFYASCFVAA